VTAPEAPVALIATEPQALPPILEVVEARENKDGAPPEVIEAIKEAQLRFSPSGRRSPPWTSITAVGRRKPPLSVIRRPQPEPREI